MGLNIVYYYLMYVIGFALMCLITLSRCRKKGISKKRGATYTLFTFFGGILGAMIMGKIFTAAANSVGINEQSRVAIFGAVMITPVFLLLALFLEKRRDPSVNIRRVMDLITPGSFTVVICGKFGCFLYGCCYGVESTNGVFNRLIEKTVFPVQLCEVASMLIILLAVYLLQKSPKFIEGTEYPVTAALYAVVRFLWEFLRFYPDRLRHFMFDLTLWQFCCIIVFSVSLISIILMRKRKIILDK